ncbi:hypothetical protein D1007_19524 [Hordeum vulgare]|nr:hypothetical protein D1007_19524 [Hordeum vulgare]
MMDAVVRSPSQSSPPTVVLLGHPQPMVMTGACQGHRRRFSLPSRPCPATAPRTSLPRCSKFPLTLVESQRPDAMDVFMPPEDLNVAMRLAVVSIEPSNVFVTATSAVQANMLRNLGHLSFNTMSSSMGVCYLRFSSWEDHK